MSCLFFALALASAQAVKNNVETIFCSGQGKLVQEQKIVSALFLTASALASGRAKNKHNIIFDS